MVKDINSGSDWNPPYDLTVVGNTLFFSGTTVPTEENCGRVTELPQAHR